MTWTYLTRKEVNGTNRIDTLERAIPTWET
jgi:hypothetical protein